MVAFAPVAEPSALRLAVWPEQSPRVPASPAVWSLRYIDAAVLRDENKDNDGDCTDDDGDERLYYTTDANMNVTALTDKNGDEVERYVYDPYGNCTVYDDDWSATVAWADSKKNTIRYCGYHFDSETGLYHVRNRMYHSPLGLWLQRDPLGYVDGMSLYEYVRSGPCRYVDPKGLKLTLKDPKREAYKSRKDYDKARKYKERVEKTCRDATKTKNRVRLAGKIKQLLDKGNFKAAQALAKQLMALKLIDWADKTNAVHMVVEFVPELPNKSAEIDVSSLREPPKAGSDKMATVKMRMATEAQTTGTGISSTFFHEVLHGFYAAKTYRKIPTPAGLELLVTYLKSFKITSVTWEIGTGDKYGKFLQNLMAGKYKGQNFTFDPFLEEVSGCYEPIVHGATKQVAEPTYAARDLDAAIPEGS